MGPGPVDIPSGKPSCDFGWMGTLSCDLRDGKNTLSCDFEVLIADTYSCDFLLLW